MKIIIHSLDELKELAYLVAHGVYACNKAQDEHNASKAAGVPQPIVVNIDTNAMAAAQYEHDLHPAGYAASADKAVAETSAALRTGTNGDTPTVSVAPETAGEPKATEELDSTGRRWDEEVDSASKAKTKAGVWARSRRRDLTDERYDARVAELLAEQCAPVGDDEPVATERHALPSDAQEMELTDKDEMVPVAKDLTALVEASQESAGELAGNMQDLLAAGKAFIGEHGTGAFNELKQAVSPTDDGNGKPLPMLNPGERRLLEACIGIYAAFP